MSSLPPDYKPLDGDDPSVHHHPRHLHPRRKRSHHDRLALAALACLALTAPYLLTAATATTWPKWGSDGPAKIAPSPRAVAEFAASVARCEVLDVLPGPPSDFHQRKASDRFVEGTKAVLIRNATVWTGLDDGKELLVGYDVLLDRGLIISIEPSGEAVTASLPEDTITHDAHGAWLTPGIVDMHSHIGVDSAPELSGADDTNSIGRPVNPFLRSLDGINTHDLSRIRSTAGGITTSLVLPGSANSIGGQAFAIKLRQTAAKTPDSMVLEMPYNVAGAPEWRKGDPPRWLYFKMACGENIRRVYKQTRMDLSHNFRTAFNSAKDLKLKQDDFCAKVKDAQLKGDVLAERFPDDLEWEALTDVLRGKVKVNTHCYESTDFAAFIRHSNEFKFPVAAFHHAHEAWIVPDLLKQTWGGTPAVALFATNARYKREAWRGTEYAPKILEENNITVIMKSDHPVLDSRYLPFEAQQAHHFGLSAHKALASITTSSAEVAGLGHRVGYVRPQWDADIVLWDSHPLSLGATPTQVWIDGIQQLARPYSAKEISTDTKPPPVASVPEDPLTLQDEDDPWNGAAHKDHHAQAESHEEVVFTNVNEVLISDAKGGLQSLGAQLTRSYEVHVVAGKIVCVGDCFSAASSSARVVDLKGGSLLPPIVGYGPGLGLIDIISEKSAQDNAVFDPLMSGDLSRTQQLWGPTVAVKAVDGLAFGGKHLLISHSAGVTKAVTAPTSKGFFSGVSVAFRTNAKNILDEGAIIDEAVALHVSLGHYKAAQTPSISTEIAELRGLLLGGLAVDVSDGQSSDYFALAANGKLPLVINAAKADHLASLVRLKKEIERSPNQTDPLRWVVHGGQEAHLVASELAEAGIAVILDPPRAFPGSWDERRALAGPPLTEFNPATALEKAGVKVGLGVPEEWQARQLLWEAAWAQKDSGGEVDRRTAVGWVSSNLEEILGLSKPHKLAEFVAYERDPFEFGSRAVAVSSANGQRVEILKN